MKQGVRKKYNKKIREIWGLNRLLNILRKLHLKIKIQNSKFKIRNNLFNKSKIIILKMSCYQNLINSVFKENFSVIKYHFKKLVVFCIDMQILVSHFFLLFLYEQGQNLI